MSKKIEVFSNDNKAMLIKLDDWSIELTAEEAAELSAKMSAAYSGYEIHQESPRGPGHPLDRVRPASTGTWA